MDVAIGLFVAQVLQEVGRFSTKKSQGLPLHGQLQGRPDETDLVNRLAWPENDMDVLGRAADEAAVRALRELGYVLPPPK
jgi:hypothetical protein